MRLSPAGALTATPADPQGAHDGSARNPAAVVSLWSVDDEGTRDLMVRFYENMIRKGGGTAESLRFAKQEMLKTKYGDPFFWSTFVMYGE